MSEKINDAINQLGHDASKLYGAAEGCAKLHEDMQGEWCGDSRYYGFQAMFQHLMCMSARIADEVEELSTLLNAQNKA